MKFWIPKAINIRKITDTPGVRTSRHDHNYAQAGFILDGFLMIELDQRHIWRVNAGEFYNIAQYQPHIIAAPPNVTPITVDLRFKGGLAGSGRIAMVDPGFHAMDILINVTFKITTPHARQIGIVLKEMLAFDAIPYDIRAFILTLCLMRMAKCVAKTPRLTYRRQREAAQEHDAVLNALDIIHKRYHQPLAVKSISAEVGLSRGRLIRLFRRYIRVTPKQYLLHHRIESAKRLMMLRDTQALKNIAFLTGFQDLQQFSRAFHRIEGCAPSEFIA